MRESRAKMLATGIVLTIAIAVLTPVTWIMGLNAIMFMFIGQMCVETSKSEREEKNLRGMVFGGAMIILLPVCTIYSDWSLLLSLGIPMFIGIIFPYIWHHFCPIERATQVDLDSGETMTEEQIVNRKKAVDEYIAKFVQKIDGSKMSESDLSTEFNLMRNHAHAMLGDLWAEEIAEIMRVRLSAESIAGFVKFDSCGHFFRFHSYFDNGRHVRLDF